MLGILAKSAPPSRGALPERPDAGPRLGVGMRSLVMTVCWATTLVVVASAHAQGVPGGLEVASRSAHRTAPRFPSQADGGAQQADHQSPVGEDGRGYVQPAQYVPRSRLMQNRMMARGGYSTTMGQTMFEGDLGTESEVVYEGTTAASMGPSTVMHGDVMVGEGDVIYEGDFPPGMVPPGARAMSGGSQGRAGGLFRGGLLGGGATGGGMGARGGLFRGGMMGNGAMASHGHMEGGMGCSSCGGTAPVWSDGGPGCCGGGNDMGCGGCGGCGDPCGGCNGCGGCCLLFNPRTNVEVFAGAHAFRGVPNLDSSGSFGFYEGFMLSGPVPCLPGEPISWEFGGLFSQTDFQGSPYTDNSRQQVFGTAGLFRRVDWGLQGGLVADFMNDHWYATANLFQIRGEISWLYPSGHEIGFWGTHGINQSGDTANINFAGAVVSDEIDSESIDIYAAFYRKTFCEGGDARVFGGVTDHSHAVVGADVRLPVTCNWGLQAGFTYLISSEDAVHPTPGTLDFDEIPEDAWNVNVGIVWSFGGRLKDPCNYHRALLPVANNGTFIMHRRLAN